MLLFLRDADVVDEWLRTQQNLLSDDLQSPTTFDIDRTQRDIIDIERRQGIVQNLKGIILFLLVQISCYQ